MPVPSMNDGASCQLDACCSTAQKLMQAHAMLAKIAHVQPDPHSQGEYNHS